MSPIRTCGAQTALNFAPSRETFIAALGTTEAEAYDTIEKTMPHFTALMQARALLRAWGWWVRGCEAGAIARRFCACSAQALHDFLVKRKVET